MMARLLRLRSTVTFKMDRLKEPPAINRGINANKHTKQSKSHFPAASKLSNDQYLNPATDKF